MVLCKCEQCGYYNRGHCERRFPSFDEGGHCTYLYQRGVLRPDAFAAIDDMYKNKIQIIDVEVQDVKYGNDERNGTKDEGAAESGGIKECESSASGGIDSENRIPTGDNFRNYESSTMATGSTEVHNEADGEERSDELVEGV